MLRIVFPIDLIRDPVRALYSFPRAVDKGFRWILTVHDQIDFTTLFVTSDLDKQKNIIIGKRAWKVNNATISIVNAFLILKAIYSLFVDFFPLHTDIELLQCLETTFINTCWKNNFHRYSTPNETQPLWFNGHKWGTEFFYIECFASNWISKEILVQS